MGSLPGSQTIDFDGNFGAHFFYTWIRPSSPPINLITIVKTFNMHFPFSDFYETWHVFSFYW